MRPCTVVAELGCVHIGSMDRAKELIRLAKMSGADCVKFQKRNPIECVPQELKDKPHPNQIFAYGKTYLEHRQNLELTIEQQKELQIYCSEIGIGYAISVFDATSAKEVVDHLNPMFVKVPSSCNLNQKILNILFDTSNFDIHISLGMSEQWEIMRLIHYLHSKKSPERWMVYHCTSEYPCPFEHLYLAEIPALKHILPGIRIGFSNHGKGIAADIAAYVLGASWIERHFIDDRTFRHTDASSSLEPQGLYRLCRDLKAVCTSMGHKTGLSDAELKERAKLRVENNDSIIAD